jgi:putative acetyltransferase
LPEDVDVRIRLENPADAPEVRRVVEAAFGQSAEADLVEALRREARPYFSLVAVRGGELVGHIAFSPVTIGSESPSDGVGLAPMAVLPRFQRQGIGSRLVRAGLLECERAGRRVVVVLGHPGFYPRFGFVPASPAGLRSEYPVSDEHFMVLELAPGALQARSGLVRYHPAFSRFYPVRVERSWSRR